MPRASRPPGVLAVTAGCPPCTELALAALGDEECRVDWVGSGATMAAYRQGCGACGPACGRGQGMDPLMVSVPAGGRHREPMVPRERPQWTAALHCLARQCDGRLLCDT